MYFHLDLYFFYLRNIIHCINVLQIHFPNSGLLFHFLHFFFLILMNSKFFSLFSFGVFLHFNVVDNINHFLCSFALCYWLKKFSHKVMNGFSYFI